MERNDLRKIEEKLGYFFTDEELLIQAFTRKSYTNEKGGENNEILEFIGDKALDMAVIIILMKEYSNYNDFGKRWCRRYFYTKNLYEGDFTEIKRKLVEGKMLARRIEMMGLEQYLIMGKGDKAKNVDEEISVKEDLFEAIIGAIVIDSHNDASTIEQVVTKMLDPFYYLNYGFPDDDENYIGLLQEWSQKKYNEAPVYNYISVGQGFSASVRILNLTKFDVNVYSSKDEAKYNVAKMMYKYLEGHGLLFSIRDEIGEIQFEKSINQLQELHQKGKISKPIYLFTSKPEEQTGDIIWCCTCVVQSYNCELDCYSKNKKDAKKGVAFDMLNHIFSNIEKIEKDLFFSNNHKIL